MTTVNRSELPQVPDYPSLRLVRPILGLPTDFRENLAEEIVQYDLRIQQMRLLLSANSHVPLVSANELLNLYMAVGEEPTQESMDELAGYLEVELPSSFDDKVTIKLRPLEYVQFLALRHSGDENSGYRSKALFRSPGNKRLTQERRIAHLALYRFFEISDPSSLDLTNIWTNASSRRLKLGTAIGVSNITKLYTFCKESTVIPEEVTLDGVIIDEV